MPIPLLPPVPLHLRATKAVIHLGMSAILSSVTHILQSQNAVTDGTSYAQLAPASRGDILELRDGIKELAVHFRDLSSVMVAGLDSLRQAIIAQPGGANGPEARRAPIRSGQPAIQSFGPAEENDMLQDPPPARKPKFSGLPKHRDEQTLSLEVCFLHRMTREVR